mgnify:CR=1 FL=1
MPVTAKGKMMETKSMILWICVAMLVAAHAHCLGACWVSMEPHPYAPAIKTLLGVADTQHLLAVVALGYPVETPSPGKRPLADMVRYL